MLSKEIKLKNIKCRKKDKLQHTTTVKYLERKSLNFSQQTLNDLCNIEPGDKGGNVTETINTVVFIGSLLMN